MTSIDHRLVFIHGIPGTRASWGSFTAHAPAGTSCEVWDLLDHGDMPPSEGSLDELVADLAERLAQRDGPVTLVAHSFGTWAALRAAAVSGSPVRELISIAGVGHIPPELAAQMDQFAAALESGALDVDTSASIALDGWLPVDGRRPEHVEAIRGAFGSEGAPRLIRQLRRLGRSADPRHRLERSPVPLRLVQCAGDRAVPVPLGRELEALDPAARMVLLEGDSHFPHWTHEDELARHLFGG